MKLPASFYRRKDVFRIAKELLGKFLVTEFNGKRTAGMITETEAYNGIIDRASHAFNGRRTGRTKVMYSAGGTAYVYICYGIHHLFNVVTNEVEIPHAILIRGVEPVEGTELMMKRRGMKQLDFALTSGPGALAQAMGIRVEHSGMSLLNGNIWIENRNVIIQPRKMISSRRVGIEGAGDAAKYPYRYYLSDNPWVSKHPK